MSPAKDISGADDRGSSNNKYHQPQAGAQKMQALKNVRVFNDNVILVNPNVDASDKELYQRNGFKSAGKNLTSFLKNGDTAVYMADVEIPASFGLLTKDNMGQEYQLMQQQHQP